MSSWPVKIVLKKKRSVQLNESKISPILLWSQVMLVISIILHHAFNHPSAIKRAREAGRAEAIRELVTRHLTECDDRTLEAMIEMVRREEAH